MPFDPDRRALLRAFAWLSALVVVPGGALAGPLAAILSRGALRVGTSFDYAPFSSKTSTLPSGFDVELVNLAAKHLGVRAEFVPFAWPDLAADLAAGKFDFAASGVTRRADRALTGLFTRPYAVTGAVVLVRKADAARFSSRESFDDPAVRLAVNKGGHLERTARRLFPRATLDIIDDNTKLYDRVRSRAADAAVSDDAEAYAHHAGDLVPRGPFTRDRKAFYVRSDAPDLARALDAFLAAREDDGLLPKLRQKWLGTKGPSGLRAHEEAILADIELRMELMPLVGAAKRAVQKPIEDLAQEQRVFEKVGRLARAAGLEAEPVIGVYRVLVQTAKIIQLAPTFAPAAVPSLDVLRSAIGAIDEHLVPMLGRTAGRVDAAEFRKATPESVHVPTLPDSLLLSLADALAAVRLAPTPAPALSSAATIAPTRTIPDAAPAPHPPTK